MRLEVLSFDTVVKNPRSLLHLSCKVVSRVMPMCQTQKDRGEQII